MPRPLSGFGGTGLGLAITRKLARMMGGDVTVASFFEGLAGMLATTDAKNMKCIDPSPNAASSADRKPPDVIDPNDLSS